MDVLQMARWEHVHLESIGVSLSDLALTGGEHGGPELGREACPSQAAYIHCDYRLRDSTVDVLRDAVARGLDLWWLQRSERLPQELWGGPLGDDDSGSGAPISRGTWTISPLRALRNSFSIKVPRRAAAGFGQQQDRGSNELRVGVRMTKGFNM